VLLAATVAVLWIAGCAIWRYREGRYWQPSAVGSGSVSVHQMPEPPPLVLLVAGLALCVYGYIALTGRSVAGTTLWSAGVVVAVAASAAAGRDWIELHPARAAAVAGVLGLLWVLLGLPAEDAVRRQIYRRSVLLLIVLFAFGLRWGELRMSVDRHLDPDAQIYLTIARGMQDPFATGPREPFTIWLVRIALVALGDTGTSLRVASVGFSVLAVAASYVLASRFFGWRVGCAAAAFLAWWPDARAFSILGLRDELLAAGVWVFLGLLYGMGRHGSPRARNAVLLALATAAVLLTSLAALWPVVLLLGFAASSGRIRLRVAVAALAFGLCLVTPYAWWNWKHKGDPFYSVNMSARGFANYESAGKAGFPSREEVRSNLFAGRRITMAEYIFGEHSISQIATRALRGYGRLVDGHLRGPVTIRGRRIGILLGLWVIGGAFALLVVPGRLLIFAILFWLGPVAFLAGALEFDLDPRLASPIWALQASLMGLAVIVMGRGWTNRRLDGQWRLTGLDDRGAEDAAPPHSRR
jgi:hypothetical protein